MSVCVVPGCEGKGRLPVACLTDGDFSAKVVFTSRAVCSLHEKAMQERTLERLWPALATHFYGLPRPTDAGRTYPVREWTRMLFVTDEEATKVEEIAHMVRR